MNGPPEPRELLRSLRAAYAKGPEAFDRTVLRREPSTIRRWLRGQSPIPSVVLTYLENVRRQIGVKGVPNISNEVMPEYDIAFDESKPDIVDPITDVRD
jgi:hypothetical protein